MKKILSIISLALFVSVSSQTNQTTAPSGASTTENYIYSRTYLEAVTTSNATAKQVQAIQYFDGLGRPKQSIAIKASPKGNDIVTPIVYDGFGREVDSYLPVSMTTTTGGIQSLTPADVITYYTSPKNTTTKDFDLTDANPFSHKSLENSPLDRVLAQTQVGNAWSNKPVSFDYLANEDNEVKKYVATFNYTTFGATLSIASATDNNANSGFYKNSQLYKNTVTDEDGNVNIEFKNGQGQTLLVRKVVSATQNADTYYVYNDYDQLAFVIPPLAADKFNKPPYNTSGISIDITSADFNSLCYQYKYDVQNRLVEKKLPGKGWEYMIYDKQDRLIATQDAVLATTQNNFGAIGWLFTKYDQFGRVVYTGFTANASTRSALQSTIDTNTTNSQNNESRTDTIIFTQNGLGVYYTKTAFPTTVTKLLSVNYYDTYPNYTDAPPRPDYIIDANLQKTLPNTSYPDRSLKGLPTASFVKNIEDDNWTKNYTWYDTKGRVIGTHSQNHLGGYTKTETLLDFAGVPQETYTKHKRLATDAELEVKETFVYDTQNRLLQHLHQVNNNQEETLAENTYNELGQLSNKAVGNNLQSIDYTYNIRGWMTGINSADVSTTAPYSLDNGKLFGYKIKYENPANTTSSSAKYNGNISEIDWMYFDSSLMRYNYQYDALNRLRAGIYQEPSTSYNGIYNELADYDLNGNIITMKRYARPVKFFTPVFVDNLSYVYENSNQSNRLQKVTDATNNTSGYPKGGGIITYDNNGNMTAMPDKGITNIAYNYLNLPTVITQTSPTNLYYRADGVKIKKVFTLNNTAGSTPITTEYLDGFQYATVESSQVIQALDAKDEETISISAARQEESISREIIDNPENIVPSTNALILSFFPTAEGYFDFKNNRYIYQYKDHLGNARISYTKNQTGGADVIDRNDYYPFGLNFINAGAINTVYNPLSAPYNYKYSSQELQETGMYAMDFRHYMPDIGRFTGMDELGEIDASLTLFHYANNNPISFSDPTGLYTGDPNGNFSTSNPDEIKALLGYFRGGGSLSNVGSYVLGNSTFAKEIPEVILQGSRINKFFTGNYFSNDNIRSVYNHLNKHIGSMATISEWDGDKGFWGNMSSSNEPLHQLAYGILNDFYISAQVLDTGNWLGAKNYNSPTGNLAYTNLDGSGQYNANDRGFTFATTVTPFALKGVKVELNMVKNSVLKTMNAGQYNKLFKGSFITKLQPSIRGAFYKVLNDNKRDVNVIVKWLSDPLNMNSAKQAVENAEKNKR